MIRRETRTEGMDRVDTGDARREILAREARHEEETHTVGEIERRVLEHTTEGGIAVGLDEHLAVGSCDVMGGGIFEKCHEPHNGFVRRDGIERNAKESDARESRHWSKD